MYICTCNGVSKYTYDALTEVVVPSNSLVWVLMVHRHHHPIHQLIDPTNKWAIKISQVSHTSN